MKLNKSNQLDLFDPSYPKKVDQAIFTISNQMMSYKWLALLTEIAFKAEDNRELVFAFNRVKLAAVELSKLCALLSPYSGEYRGYSKEKWKTMGAYDPYYPALEPRSTPALSRHALELDRSSKAILLRFKAILADRGDAAREIIKEFTDLSSKAAKTYQDSYRYEY